MSDEVFFYFPDPVKGVNKTRVFAKSWCAEGFSNGFDLKKYLVDFAHANNGIGLRKPEDQEPWITLKILICDDPRIFVACEVPSGKPDTDFNLIYEVLSANGLNPIIE